MNASTQSLKWAPRTSPRTFTQWSRVQFGRSSGNRWKRRKTGWTLSPQLDRHTVANSPHNADRYAPSSSHLALTLPIQNDLDLTPPSRGRVFPRGKYFEQLLLNRCLKWFKLRLPHLNLVPDLYSRHSPAIGCPYDSILIRLMYQLLL